MRKWIFGLLLLANLVFFAVMYWGEALTVDANNPPAQAALNADKIKLMSLEVSASAAVAASSVSASGVPAAPVVIPEMTAASRVAATPVKLNCMEWGEFSGAALARVEKILGEMKLESHLKTRTVEYGNAYWVFIPAMKKRAKAEKKIEQLKSLGVEDFFLIQEAGAWKNAISLGVFKTEDAAKKYLAKLQGLGVKSAKVAPRASKLKATVFTLSRLDGAQSSKIAGLHKDFLESELKLVPCGE